MSTTKSKNENEPTLYCPKCLWEGNDEDLKTVTDLSRDDHEIGYDKVCPNCESGIQEL